MEGGDNQAALQKVSGGALGAGVGRGGGWVAGIAVGVEDVIDRVQEVLPPLMNQKAAQLGQAILWHCGVALRLHAALSSRWRSDGGH